MNRKMVAHTAITVNASTEAVWDALTNPDKIKQYMFGTQVTSDWKQGSQIVWKGNWKGNAYQDKGEILMCEPGRLLQYSHFSPLTGQPDVPNNYHTVTITLSPAGESTHVTLSQDNNANQQERGHSLDNWTTMLAELKRVVEKR